MSRLDNGQAFPPLDVPAVGGGMISLPGDLAGSYGVILIYRGSWCPYCNAQLAAFSRALDTLSSWTITAISWRPVRPVKVAATRPIAPPIWGKGQNPGQSIPGQFKGGPCPALLQPMSFLERSFAQTTVGIRADTKRGPCEANTR
jgi:hypothetical protein